MSASLTTAIRIGDAAKAILRKTKQFPDKSFLGNEEREHLGVEPILLALSMELALKAWIVFDHDDPKVIKSHNLIKLFDRLKPESQRKLEAEFKKSVAPYHPNGFDVDHSIRDILHHHQDAFTDWRYLHEVNEIISFNQSVFEATLEMVLREFEKRYRTVHYPPTPPRATR